MVNCRRSFCLFSSLVNHFRHNSEILEFITSNLIDSSNVKVHAYPSDSLNFFKPDTTSFVQGAEESFSTVSFSKLLQDVFWARIWFRGFAKAE